jgi:hypothetical protein
MLLEEIIKKLNPTTETQAAEKKSVKILEQVPQAIKRQLTKIQQDKAKSISVQTTLLAKAGIKMDSTDFVMTNAHKDKVAKLEETGLALEMITLEVEKRYEAMFLNYNTLIDSLKSYISNILNEQKKDLFNSLLATKTQNANNFNTLWTKLYEAAFLSGTEARSSPQVVKTLEAFRLFVKFSEDFKEDFYSMISSKLANHDIKNIQLDVSRLFTQLFSQSLIPPKRFPTELITFFETIHDKSKTSQYLHKDVGPSIGMSMKYPNSVQLTQREDDLQVNLPYKGGKQ